MIWFRVVKQMGQDKRIWNKTVHDMVQGGAADGSG
jgi:hypothetical protein